MEFIITNDGSHTLIQPEAAGGQTYHSKHGAITESQYVFLDMGYRAAGNSSLNILEVGFGSGLNALLTVLAATEDKRTIAYTALEPKPVPMDVAHCLNYPELLGCGPALFIKMHAALQSGIPIELNPYFTFTPYQADVQQFEFPGNHFDLIYFDAFSPGYQPELWKESVFQQVFVWMKPGGIVVTYCAQSAMQRALKAAGFKVERLNGAPGKREMVRARKLQ